MGELFSSAKRYLQAVLRTSNGRFRGGRRSAQVGRCHQTDALRRFDFHSRADLALCHGCRTSDG